jgi:hypothetical protein
LQLQYQATGIIEVAPLAKAVHIADDARSISIMTTIELTCFSASYKAGEKHVSSFLLCHLSNYSLYFRVCCLSAKSGRQDQREIKKFPQIAF